MANINNIIQEINTNLPDNNAQRITAQKLRDTLINELYETTEIYDVSTNNNGTKYADISAAIGSAGANIPYDIRKGGMTIRFINSSNDKYEQWLYIGTSTLNEDISKVSNWQGVDNILTPNSNNLIKNGAIEIETRKGSLILNNDNLALFVNEYIDIKQADIEQGGYSYTRKTDSTIRIRCKFAIPLSAGTKIEYDTKGKEIVFCFANELNQNSWNVSIERIGAGTINNVSNRFLFLIIRFPNEAAISPSDFNCDIRISNKGLSNLRDDLNELSDKIDNLEDDDKIYKNFEIGAYNGVTPVENTKRARFPLTPIKERIFVSGVDMTKYRIQIVISDNGTYVSTATYTQEEDDNANGIGYILPNAYIGLNNIQFGVVLVNKTNADITDEELENINNTVQVTYGIPKIKGKNILRYKFGGPGNDWCFIRTPENYDGKRINSFPMVITNHGNGWTMDNTPYTMNWTNITMYAPASYINSLPQTMRDRFIETSDFSLWWSNPTIEALLNAGYVVCGTENYGDALYGNENCRKACELFYEHVIKNYNVQERCCMIGASNGAQTSINTAYILGDKVKAMILQYPLTCLINQYFFNSSQQAGIRSAYNINDPYIDRNGLISATKTHDVTYTDVIDNTKLGYFPPCKLYYSLGDTVVNANDNAIILYNLLNYSLKIVEKVECTGDHGDVSHFDPTGYVDFFEKY